MSISSVTQTIAASPVVSAPVSAAVESGSVQSGSAAGSFTTASLTRGAQATTTLSGNPITSLSSDLQSYLLQQQSQGAASASGHHHTGHHGGTEVDSPNLPGAATSGATG